MIPKPIQQDRNSAAEYLHNVSKQAVRAKEDINIEWQLYPSVLGEIAPAAIENINEQLVSLLEAWMHNADNENAPAVIEKVASAENAVIEASILIWKKLAHFTYGETVRVTEKKSKRSVANLEKANRLKLKGKALYDSANNPSEQGKGNAAVQDYKKAVDFFRQSKEEAELAMSSVSGQTLLARRQNLFRLLTLIATAIGATVSIILLARSCRVESKQIPSNTIVPAETNEPNLSK